MLVVFRQYYKSYGLNAENLLLWFKKQIQSTQSQG